MRVSGRVEEVRTSNPSCAATVRHEVRTHLSSNTKFQGPPHSHSTIRADAWDGPDLIDVTWENVIFFKKLRLMLVSAMCGSTMGSNVIAGRSQECAHLKYACAGTIREWRNSEFSTAGMCGFIAGNRGSAAERNFVKTQRASEGDDGLTTWK